MPKPLDLPLLVAPAALLAASSALHGGSAPTLLARTDDPAPSEIGGAIDVLAGVSVHPSGNLVFGLLNENGDQALVRGTSDGGAFEAAVTSNSVVPIVGDSFVGLVLTEIPEEFNALFRPTINVHGDVGFFAIVGEFDVFPGDLSGYVSPAEGELRLAWRFRNPIPGFAGNGNANNDERAPFMSDDGIGRCKIAFANEFERWYMLRVDGAGITPVLEPTDTLPDGTEAVGRLDARYTASGASVITVGSRLLTATDTGVLTLVSPVDGSAPGVEGVGFAGFNAAWLAPDGTVAACGRYESSPITRLFNDEGLWTTQSGALELALRENDPAVGAPGLVYDSFPRVIANAQGSVLAPVLLRDQNAPVNTEDTTTAYYNLSVTSEPELLAIEGGDAPGIDGAVIGGLFPQGVMSNPEGDLVFYAQLVSGPGGVQAGVNDVGLWFYDADGGTYEVLVRTGDAVDVARACEAPDPRTVSEIIVTPETAFASNGLLAYTLGFTDGTFATFATTVGGATVTCAGDFDSDGDVDMGDFGVFASAFDSALGDDAYAPEADFNADNDVDLGDFGVFGAQFGRTDCAP